MPACMETAQSGRLQRPRVGLLAVQGAAVIVAAAFLLAAIAGFIPGLTTHLDQLHWLGHESRAELFGIFEVSVLHNVAHLAFGVAGLVLSSTFARARAYLIGGGVIYLGLWVYGLLVLTVSLCDDHGGGIRHWSCRQAVSGKTVVCIITVPTIGPVARRTVNSQIRSRRAEDSSDRHRQ